MYYLVSFVISFLFPLAALFVAYRIIVVIDAIFYSYLAAFNDLRFIGFIGLVLVLSAVAGYLTAKQASMPKSFIGRFWPLAAPIWLLLQALIPYTLLTQEPSARELFFLGPAIILPPYLFYWLAFIVASESRSRSSRKMSGIIYVLSIFIICALATTGSWIWARQDILQGAILKEATAYHDGYLCTNLYRPFFLRNRLVKPVQEPSLAITANYPRLDGAAALLPIYSAAAQAIYKGLDRHEAQSYIEYYTDTPSAYRRLINGQADIFFGLSPSPEQQEYAQSKGLTLTRTLIAREALIFLTHKDNPVENLTLEQIRAIYSNKITHWRKLGGDNAKIIAFQRPENSESQIMMKETVMQGRLMAKPPKEEIDYNYIYPYTCMDRELAKDFSSHASELTRNVAPYRNHKNALGYSFRWYVVAHRYLSDIKFLSVDGISPTPENIQNGRYPLTIDFEAVTARPLSPESQALIAWLTSSEGQDLISRAGYTPIGKPALP